MKGVSWTTAYEIGDGGVLMVLATFDGRTLRARCPVNEERVRFAIEKISETIRIERARAKQAEYSTLH